MKPGSVLFLLAVVALLAACAAPRLHVHTLLAAPVPAVADTDTGMAFALGRVRVPAGVDRRELVLRVDAARVQQLENRHWSAALPDEVRAALAAQLAAQLGARDVSAVAVAGDVPVYRIAIDLQRFDARLDRDVAIEAVWSLRAPDDTIISCSSRIHARAEPGIDALVRAAQQALAQLSQTIAVPAAAHHHQKQTLICPP